MIHGCSPLKKLSNGVKIKQIGQVMEKLWSKQWTDKDISTKKRCRSLKTLSNGCKGRANRTSNGEVMVKTMDRGCRPLKKLSNGVKIEQIGQVTEKLWSKQWTGYRHLKKLSNSVKIEQIGQVMEKLWSKQWTEMLKKSHRPLYPFEKLSNDVKIEQIGQVTEKLWSKQWTGPFKKLSNDVKIEQIGQVTEKLWLKQWTGCRPLKKNFQRCKD
ncbi:hypothetical protein OROMI_034972 [Orobanche minor]